jgi:hypothetical protein
MLSDLPRRRRSLRRSPVCSPPRRASRRAVHAPQQPLARFVDEGDLVETNADSARAPGEDEPVPATRELDDPRAGEPAVERDGRFARGLRDRDSQHRRITARASRRMPSRRTSRAVAFGALRTHSRRGERQAPAAHPTEPMKASAGVGPGSLQPRETTTNVVRIQAEHVAHALERERPTCRRIGTTRRPRGTRRRPRRESAPSWC